MNTKTTNTKAIINVTRGISVGSNNVSQIGASFDCGPETDRYIVVTPEQAESFARVVKHQGKSHYQGAYMDLYGECLMVNFEHIVIGIEQDGYAHS